MSVFQGDCNCCGRTNVIVFDHSGQCSPCERIEHLERKVENLEKRLKYYNQVPESINEEVK